MAQAGYRDGPAKDTLLSQPRGLCHSPLHGLFFVDAGNALVRRWQSGTVSTVVGQAGQPGWRDGADTVAQLTMGSWDLVGGCG